MHIKFGSRRLKALAFVVAFFAKLFLCEIRSDVPTTFVQSSLVVFNLFSFHHTNLIVSHVAHSFYSISL